MSALDPADEPATLVGLLDGLLDRGVHVAGDLSIGLADVELIRVALRVLVASEETAQRTGGGRAGTPLGATGGGDGGGPDAASVGRTARRAAGGGVGGADGGAVRAAERDGGGRRDAATVGGTLGRTAGGGVGDAGEGAVGATERDGGGGRDAATVARTARRAAGGGVDGADAEHRHPRAGGSSPASTPGRGGGIERALARRAAHGSDRGDAPPGAADHVALRPTSEPGSTAGRTPAEVTEAGSTAGRTRAEVTSADREQLTRGIAQLVLTVVEVVRELLERQAIRRVEAGSLDEDQVERLGVALEALEERMGEVKDVFGVTDEDLNLDLGPLGRLR